MSWVFFVRGLEPCFVDNALARRVAETERLIAVGPNVSLLRSPGQLSFRKRLSKPPAESIEAYYRPLHFPARLPAVGAVCAKLKLSLFRREMGRILSDRPTIVCYNSPIQHNMVGVLEESLSVYYVTDDFTVDLQGGPIPGELEAEQDLLERIDLVICVSQPLAQLMRGRAPKGKHHAIHLLPNFYDERVFNPEMTYPEPEALRDVPCPRILVAGHISDRIDWDGIAAASKLRPDWSWVFLGRSSATSTEARIDQLAGRGILLPGVPYAAVPAWIQHSDACSVPYRLNRFTLSSDPVKAPEYLAMGAPVLSTRIPALSRFGEAVYWVEEGNGGSYAKALDAATERSGSHELRALRTLASVPDSLTARAHQFRTIIQERLSNVPVSGNT